jgi:hypothetical protein
MLHCTYTELKERTKGNPADLALASAYIDEKALREQAAVDSAKNKEKGTYSK